MPSKRDLEQGLSQPASNRQIRRGQGYQLSTVAAPVEDQESVTAGTSPSVQKRENAGSQDRINAETQQSSTGVQRDTPASKPPTAKPGPKRINRGYQLREDLVKALKRIALDEDRNLYDVMEEAFEQYLARRQV
jgi:hypothetical protein